MAKTSDLLMVAEWLEEADSKLEMAERKAIALAVIDTVREPLRRARGDVRATLKELDVVIGMSTRREHRERPRRAGDG